MFDRKECELTVYNSSSEWRWGPITILWKNLEGRLGGGIGPEEIILTQASGKRLPFQFDVVDPQEPDRNTIVFSLEDWIPPAKDEYTPSTVNITVRSKERTFYNRSASETQTGDLWKDPDLKVEEHYRGVKLINSRLNLWLNLDIILDLEKENYFSGSVTSALLDKREILDAGWIPEKHDREKRCMQIDYVELMRPPWDWRAYEKVSLIDKRYRLVSKSHGPVRARVTIASDSFSYDYIDPYTHETRHLACRLYRVISLYALQPYVVEELFVKAIPDSAKNWESYVNPNFVAHYFSYLSYLHHQQLEVSRQDTVPDWFTVNNSGSPYLGYGFASDRHTSPISNPHPGFPCPNGKTKSLSWQLSSECQYAHCAHLFMQYIPGDCKLEEGENALDLFARQLAEARQYFKSLTGSAWNELILRPLWVTVN